MENVRVNIDQRAINTLRAKIVAAVQEEAKSLMNKSEGLVPVDTGSVRSSKFVEAPVIDGDTVSVRCGYGGSNVKTNPSTGDATTDYAIKVHEDLNAHHITGQAKFLETPANALRGTFKDRVKGRLGL